MTNITATYKNGTFVLDEPLKIKDGAEVELLVMEDKKKKGKRAARILAEMAALPLEGKSDPFSVRDHDEALYGTGVC